MPLIEKLMKESKGWMLLDELIIPIMPILLERDRRAYAYLDKWIKDNDFWARRSALLSQLIFSEKEAVETGNFSFVWQKGSLMKSG
jgi:3-methyladenine DNA glycosylase AlkD